MSVPYADNIVFNLSLYNNENTSIPAELYISRDQAFVNNLENYYVRLIGAVFSTGHIPLFSYKNDMTVTIINSGTPSTVNVSFPPLYGDVVVVYLQQFLLGINNALKTAHINSGSPGNPPLFIYEADQMKLVVDQAYNPTLQIIGFNEVLINKFPSFMATYDTASDTYYMLYGNYGNTMFSSLPGGINYPVYVLPANVTGYSSLQEYLNVLVTCNSIPLNKQQTTSPTVATNTLGIIDTIPLTFDDVTKNAVKVYTQASPNYIDILSRGKLSEIDFKLYLVDSNYKLQPMFLNPKTSATCRLEFVNKQIVKNFYPRDVDQLHQAKF